MLKIDQLAARTRVAAPRLLAWAKRRAAEKSTWVGLAALSGALGKSVLADHLTSLGDIVPMLIGGGGAALVAASTTVKSA